MSFHLILTFDQNHFVNCLNLAMFKVYYSVSLLRHCKIVLDTSKLVWSFYLMFNKPAE